MVWRVKNWVKAAIMAALIAAGSGMAQARNFSAAGQDLPIIPHLDLPRETQMPAAPLVPAEQQAELELLNLRVSAAKTAAAEKKTGRNMPTALSIRAIFSQKPDYSLLFLDSPPRLVVNLPAAQFSFAADKADKDKILQNLRYGSAGAGRSRLIFGLKQPFRLISAEAEALSRGSAQSAWQLSLRLEPVSAAEFHQIIAAQAIPSAQAALAMQAGNEDGQTGGLTADVSRPFIVMIDPGHGDFDSGAISVNGIEEKRLVLAFAKKLYHILQRKPGIKPYLTRDSDHFLRLGARVEKARQKNADLFISIHADHIDAPNLHGATVYTLSDKASDDMAKLLAEYENKSDLLDGLPADEPPAVTNILLDMARRETRRFSEDFASRLVAALQGGGIAMINNPHRSAGFQVLRAADIPSALVELGYLSNVGDTRRIADPAWQNKTANILADAIVDYAHAHEKNKKPN